MTARTDGATESGPDAATGVEHEAAPARTSTGLAMAAALLAALGLPTTAALFWGIPGAIGVGVGTLLGRRRIVSYGAGAILIGVATAGVQDGGASVLVPCTLLALLAWDSGRYGITVGEQLGREAETVRLELTHAALNLGIGTAAVTTGYLVYLAVAGGQSVIALALLLVGAVALVTTIRT